MLEACQKFQEHVIVACQKFQEHVIVAWQKFQEHVIVARQNARSMSEVPRTCSCSKRVRSSKNMLEA